MGKYKFSNAQRLAIYIEHGEKCYLCSQPLDLQTMQVDHIIPESLLSDPDELVRVLELFGLPQDFDLNSYGNWMPSCAPCNRKKLDNVLQPSPIIQAVIQNAKDKSHKVKELAEKTVNRRQISKALSVLKQAKEAGNLSDEIKKELQPLLFFQMQERLPGLRSEAIKLTPEYEVSSFHIFEKLVDECRELFNRNYINDARAILSQLNNLLSVVNNNELNVELKILNAVSLMRTENICGAKSNLLEVIKGNLSNLEAMAEYLELCNRAPESEDEVDYVEGLLRRIDDKYPRYVLLQYSRKHNKNEIPDDLVQPGEWGENGLLSGRLLCQLSLFKDISGDLDARDKLVEEWGAVANTSSRPHLFKVLYVTKDTLNKAYTLESVKNAISLVENERKIIKSKDPLSVRDEICWRLQELDLKLARDQLSGTEENLEQFREETIGLFAECYFDIIIHNLMLRFIIEIRLLPEHLVMIIAKCQESKVLLGASLIDYIFLQALQYEELAGGLQDFLDSCDGNALKELLFSVKEKDVCKIAEILNSKKDDNFSLMFLHALKDKSMSLAIANMVTISNERRNDLLFSRLRLTNENSGDEELQNLLSSISLDDASPVSLRMVGDLAYNIKRWDIFILSANKLLGYEIQESYAVKLHIKLAVSYYEKGDDSRAIYHAEKALSSTVDVDGNSLQYMLHIIGKSCVLKDDLEKACEYFEKYKSVGRSFPLSLEEADIYIKSDRPDKYNVALSIVLGAYLDLDNYTDEVYLAGFMQLLALQNSGLIPLENEICVKDDLYIKLDGFKDGWFYLGDDKRSLGAECILPGSDNYQAVRNKKINERVEWPAEKYVVNQGGHTVVNIVSAAAYLSIRAHEAMEHFAKLGSRPVWSVQVINSEGNLDLDNINKFFEEQYKPAIEFFESYKSSHLPFSFLCRFEGGIAKAIGRIRAENEGFIYCNNGTQDDINAQEKNAHNAISGISCVIDGLTAILLAEAGLLKDAVDNLYDVTIPVSIIRMLRDYASSLEASINSIGSAGFVKGKFQYVEHDKEGQAQLKCKILEAADHLDSLPNKVLGEDRGKASANENLEDILPNYFVDPFRISISNNSLLLTDDAMMVKAYELTGGGVMPGHFSSLSLVKALADRGCVGWDAYLRYFSLLSSCRYHLLPVYVKDMMRSVLYPRDAGLCEFTPNNLMYFNLGLVLSREYGVSNETFVSVLATFFTNIIMDDSITDVMANDIFMITLTQSLGDSDVRIITESIRQVCVYSLPKPEWRSRMCLAKLAVLDKQLALIANELGSVIIDYG